MELCAPVSEGFQVLVTTAANLMPVGSLHEKNGFFVARRVQIQYLRQVTNSI